MAQNRVRYISRIDDFRVKFSESERSGDIGSGPQGQNSVQVGSEWSSGSRIRVGFEWVYLATLLYSYLNPVLHQYFIHAFHF